MQRLKNFYDGQLQFEYRHFQDKQFTQANVPIDKFDVLKSEFKKNLKFSLENQASYSSQSLFVAIDAVRIHGIF